MMAHQTIEISGENTKMKIDFTFGGTYCGFEFSDNNQSTISLSFPDGVKPCVKTINTKCGGITVRHTENILPNSILETVIPNGYIPEKMLPSDLETILCNVFPEIWSKDTYLYKEYYKPRSKE